MSDSLAHYASQYYDPVKAHEYYMKHRVLKGGSVDKKATIKNATEASKKTIESIRNDISKLRNSNAADRESYRSETYRKVAASKAQNAEDRKKLDNMRFRLKLYKMAGEGHESDRASIKDSIKKINADQKSRISKLNSELNDLKAANIKNSKERAEKIKAFQNQISELRQLNSDLREYLANYKEQITAKASSYTTPKKDRSPLQPKKKKRNVILRPEREIVGGGRGRRTAMMHMDQSCYLAHHGILGQKWGIRRYQNEDGTWTEAGKRRYGDPSSTKSNPENSKKKFSTAKKIAIGAAIIGGTALAAYGGYKIYQNKRFDHSKAFGIEKLKEMGIETFEPKTIPIERIPIERASTPKTKTPTLTLNPSVSSSGEDYTKKILENAKALGAETASSQFSDETFDELEELTRQLLSKGR